MPYNGCHDFEGLTAFRSENWWNFTKNHGISFFNVPPFVRNFTSISRHNQEKKNQKRDILSPKKDEISWVWWLEHSIKFRINFRWFSVWISQWNFIAMPYLLEPWRGMQGEQGGIKSKECKKKAFREATCPTINQLTDESVGGAMNLY